MSTYNNDCNDEGEHDNDTTVAVSGAIQAIRKGIDRIIEKRRTMLMKQNKTNSSSLDDALDRCERRMKMLLSHLQHLLIDLNRKRRSLKTLLEFSSKVEWPRLVSSGDLERNPIEVLGHTIQLFVRCQDGLMMLTSGECRHKYDVQQVQSDNNSKNKKSSSRQSSRYKFKSLLPTLEKRNDGYTSLYKADAVYTGYGWDEYANETVGVRQRLIEQLRKIGHKDPWGVLERQNRTELLESILSEHEVDMKEIQQDLQKWKRQIIDDIQSRLRPSNLKFVSQDKMERLSMVHNNQSLEFERRADSFQIDGPLLPHHMIRTDDWKRSLSLQLQHKRSKNNFKSEENEVVRPPQLKKKRRIIVDSDSDDDENCGGKHVGDNTIILDEQPKISMQPSSKNHKDVKNSDMPSVEPNGKTTGLRVRVANTDNLTTESGQSSSVAAIKAGMGVDTNQLETAREALEEETVVGNTSKSAGRSSTSGNDSISREERDLLTRERILKRVQSRQVVDDDEVWDAREYLRQSCMAAGNFFLWEQPNYDRSIKCFERAKALTEEQQIAHKISSESSNDVDTVESRITARNIIYLLTQATVNIGIVLVVSSEKNGNQMRRNGRRAIEMFETGRSLTRDILELTKSKQDQNHSTLRLSISIEDIFDALKAKELNCMASRWMAEALWATGQESRAMEVLDEASTIYKEHDINLNCCEVVDVVDLAGECIYAADKLAELAYSRLKQISRSSTMSSSSREKGDALLARIEMAMNRHIEVYNSIGKFGGSFDVDSDISSASETASNLNEITSWWNKTKEGIDMGRNRLETSRQSETVRADLSSVPAPDFLTGNVTASYTTSTTNRSKNTTRNDSTSSHTHDQKRQRLASPSGRRSKSFGRPSATADASTSFVTADPITYRKWGDELVKEKNDGVIPYPTTAPPIPPEFQALLDMNKVSIAQAT